MTTQEDIEEFEEFEEEIPNFEEAERYADWLKGIYTPPMSALGYIARGCVIVYDEQNEIEKFIIIFSNEDLNPSVVELIVHKEDISDDFSQGKPIQ